MAGSISYIAPIENASGKIFGKKSRFTAVTRTWGNCKCGCTWQGYRDLVAKPYTESEKARKAKFTAVAAAVVIRLANPEYIDADKAAFNAQTEYKTLRQYVWNQEWQAYQA